MTKLAAVAVLIAVAFAVSLAAGVATVAALVVVHVFSCWWYPWAYCLRCDGAGRLARSDGKVHRDCRWCKRTGRRLRLGRWIFNRLRGRYRDGTRRDR